jgi:hypothetical protein
MSTFMRDPAAWTRDSLTREAARYVVPLSPPDRETIVGAVRGLRACGRLDGPIDTLAKDEFAFGALAAKLDATYTEVRSGLGFTILRGLPLEDALTLDEFRVAVWGIGLFFGGNMLSQNASGERITEVVDATAVDPTPRMYRSNVELRLHTDITDMLALACWHKALDGGRSTIGENFRNIPKEFRHFDGPGVPSQPGKSCTFDFKDLAAADPRAVGSVT